MANFSVLYDGKNSAVRLPDLDKTEKALSRSAELQIRGQEMLLDKSLKDKERLLETMKTVPLSFHNEMLMARQAKELEKYNNLGASLYAKYGTDLPITEQIKLGNEKSRLEQQQKTWQAQSEIAQQLQGVISKDHQGYYDHKEFDTRYKNWLKDPEHNPLDETALSVAPQSMTGWLRTQAKNLPSTTNPTLINGMRVDQRIVSDEMKKEVIFEGLKDEAKLKSVIADFDEWTRTAPQHEVIALLDKNGDGVVSPEERTVANSEVRFKDSPIVQWAMNNPNYLKQMDQDEGVSKTLPGSGTRKTTFDWSVNIGSGHNNNNRFIDQGYMPVTGADGEFSFPDYRNLGKESQTSETQIIPRVIKKDASGKETIVPLGESASFHIVGYSPAKNQLILEVDNKTSQKSYRAKDVIVVPATDFKGLLEKRPFGIFIGEEQPVFKKGALDNL